MSQLRLFCPAEDWRSFTPVTEADLPLLRKVAERLGEPFNQIGDKVFLGRRGDPARLAPIAPKPALAPPAAGDLHAVVNGWERSAQVYDHAGKKMLQVEARCEGQTGTLDPPNGVGATWSRKDSDTPPGTYRVVRVERIPQTDPDWRAYGWVYLWLEPRGGAAAAIGNVGIGWHGGGSGLADPWAAKQGWLITHGCIRSQNEDMVRLANLFEPALAAGRIVSLSVEQRGR